MQVNVNNNIHKANVRAYFGRTGMGKTTKLLNDIAELKPTRLMVWDFKHEFDLDSTDSCDKLVSHLTSVYDKPFSKAFRPNQASQKHRLMQFGVFCDTAYEVAKHGGPLMCVVEEIQMVSEPGYAIPEWEKLVSTGRQHGLIIMGTSQRPTGVDKTFLSNASHITSFGLTYEEDANRIAKTLPGVTAKELVELQPYQYFFFGDGMQKAELKGP